MSSAFFLTPSHDAFSDQSSTRFGNHGALGPPGDDHHKNKSLPSRACVRIYALWPCLNIMP